MSLPAGMQTGALWALLLASLVGLPAAAVAVLIGVFVLQAYGGYRLR